MQGFFYEIISLLCSQLKLFLGKMEEKKNVELGFYVFVYILLLKVIVGFSVVFFFLRKVKAKSHFMSI